MVLGYWVDWFVNIRAVIFLIWVSCCFGAVGAQMPTAKPAPRVLLLYSNDRLLPANLRFDEGFRATLGSAFDDHYELYAEFLDAVRFPGEERWAAMENALRVRYRERPPHVLIAAGDAALKFLQERREAMFPGVPLLFGGVRLRDNVEIKSGADIAGVPMSQEIVPTLEMALQIRPQTREVVVISGSAPEDRDWEVLARLEFRPFESRVKVTHWSGLPFAELLERASRLPPETAVFFLTYFQEPDGTPTPSSARNVERLAGQCSAPIFGPYDTYLGRGIVGGMMTDFAGEGTAVGRLVERIVAGESSSEIGIQPPRPGRFQFDARQLERWGIPARLLPAGSVVMFRSPGLWETHRKPLLVGLVVIGVQTALILLLLAARRRVREAHANLRLAADAAEMGLWHRNPATQEFDASPKWRSIFGLPPTGRITIYDVLERLPAEDKAKVEQAIGDAAGAGRSFSIEHRVILPDGRERWISSHGKVDRGTNGQALEVRGASRDITVRRQATLEVDQHRQQLAHLSRVASLGVLSGSLAHELNQPLGIILSNAQAAQDLLSAEQPDLAELRDILADIVSEDRRAGDVIKRLRAMLRRGEVSPQLIDVNANVQEVLRLARSDLIARGVLVQCDFVDPLPKILADRVQLQQVILNLIINACDAMIANAPAERVLAITTTTDGAEVRVAVRDRGVGLPEDVEALFQPFHTTKADGLGMGLAICRMLTAAYGGRLWAESNPVQGATFHLALNRAKEEA